MEITAFTMRVVLLFFPGVVCAYLVDVLVVHRTRTMAEFLTRAFALGVASYLLLYAVAAVWQHFFAGVRGIAQFQVTFFRALSDGSVPLRWAEIAAAGLTAAVLAFPLAACHNQQAVNRLGAAFAATRKLGHQDVWGYLWNSPDTGGWVDVRDTANDIVYRGRVRAYSETGVSPQLLLENVRATRISTGESLYRADATLLSLRPDCIVIDIYTVGRKG